MNVDMFLDPLADQEPIEDFLPTIPNEHMKIRGLARRRLEIQRELKDLETNLFDVLTADDARKPTGDSIH